MKTFIPKGNVRGPIIPEFVLRKSITSGAKLLYAILCNYAADMDHCWPSHATLATRLGCSVNSVKNYLSELVREELIVIEKAQYHSSVYYLLSPKDLCEGDKPNFDSQQPKFDREQPKFGYLNNFKKQEKINTPPFPPIAPKSGSEQKTSQPPSAGGVGFSLQDFESLWNAYPKKEAKGFAKIAWLQLKRCHALPPLPELFTAIERSSSSASWQREQGRFVPQMGNWLRGQRWLDMPSVPCSPEARHEQELSRIVQAQAEMERLRAEQEKAESARLRPTFDDFAAKFPSIANSGMAFGLWMYLHSQNIAPLASDVPADNKLDIIAFLNFFKRQAREKLSRQTRNKPLEQAPATALLPFISNIYQGGAFGRPPVCSPAYA